MLKCFIYIVIVDCWSAFTLHILLDRIYDHHLYVLQLQRSHYCCNTMSISDTSSVNMVINTIHSLSSSCALVSSLDKVPCRWLVVLPSYICLDSSSTITIIGLRSHHFFKQASKSNHHFIWNKYIYHNLGS